MSLWTCIACAARRAVGLETCPQCGAAAHDEGDTISGPDGAQGQRHIPQAYEDAAPAAPAAPSSATVLQQAGYTAPEAAAAAADAAPEAPPSTP